MLNISDFISVDSRRVEDRMPSETKHVGGLGNDIYDDTIIDALNKILAALKPLTGDQRRRVLQAVCAVCNIDIDISNDN